MTPTVVAVIAALQVAGILAGFAAFYFKDKGDKAEKMNHSQIAAAKRLKAVRWLVVSVLLIEFCCLILLNIGGLTVLR